MKQPMKKVPLCPKMYQGWGQVGGSCRGGVGWVMQGWGGVGYAVVGWGGSCGVGVGYAGVGWIM